MWGGKWRTRATPAPGAPSPSPHLSRVVNSSHSTSILGGPAASSSEAAGPAPVKVELGAAADPNPQLPSAVALLPHLEPLAGLDRGVPSGPEEGFGSWGDILHPKVMRDMVVPRDTGYPMSLYQERCLSQMEGYHDQLLHAVSQVLEYQGK
uniref:Uncharacterized protein n=1 Tax=Sphaerodactylus townsendi TaxID=933632 RepID=A0ACB8EMU3_9SAUR